MAEHVTIFQPADLASDVGLTRLYGALADRLGRDGQVRSGSLRDAEAAFSTLVAARGRFPIGTVRRHVCRHDAGEGDCRAAPTVEG